MPLVDELIKRLERRREKKLNKYVLRRELQDTIPDVTGLSIGSSLGTGDWTGPNLELMWADPTSSYSDYRDTEITVYNSHFMTTERRTDYAVGGNYSYTLEKNQIDAARLGEEFPKPLVYVKLKHRLWSQRESDPVYLECKNTVPAPPTITGLEWEGPTLHIYLTTEGDDISHPDTELILEE